METTYEQPAGDDGARFLRAVEIIAINPQDAKDIARKYILQCKQKFQNLSEDDIQERVADKIIQRYVNLCTASGGVTALSSIIPGLGTALAMVGGGLADGVVCMKFQVDMCLCLAETFGYDINDADAKHISFYIASGGALNKAGQEVGIQLGTKMGVRLLRQYLKGAILQSIKELFKRLGIIFTRKALEKALPFGIGVVVGASANRAMTRYVGKQAKKFFLLDREIQR